jgi:hypothetical protein
MMGRGLYGKLSDPMIREADWVAAKRTEDGKTRPTQRPNAAVIDILGARCERAAKICFEPIVWNKLPPAAAIGDVPDLGDFIDVKGVRLDEHCLVVKIGGVKMSWAYLLVSAENHPHYWLAGWLWGHEVATDDNLERSFGPYIERPAYRIHPEQLHKPYLLQRIARERVNGGANGSDTRAAGSPAHSRADP